MERARGICPQTERQLIDGYFMEQRNNLLDLAAFLDRLDRARERDAGDDFRIVALRRALGELSAEGPSRVERIQLILSDPRTELLEQLDRKAAFGAYGGPNREVG
ncbi:MAG: hypothetical protein M3O34_20610 [Chloroflexota bacterium]|nr:hypothetical protein [Chloroflexota bacterium]